MTAALILVCHHPSPQHLQSDDNSYLYTVQSDSRELGLAIVDGTNKPAVEPPSVGDSNYVVDADAGSQSGSTAST
jgi:hypothetical protein